MDVSFYQCHANYICRMMRKFLHVFLPIAGASAVITDTANEVPIRRGAWFRGTVRTTLNAILVFINKIVIISKDVFF